MACVLAIGLPRVLLPWRLHPLVLKRGSFWFLFNRLSHARPWVSETQKRRKCAVSHVRNIPIWQANWRFDEHALSHQRSLLVVNAPHWSACGSFPPHVGSDTLKLVPSFHVGVYHTSQAIVDWCKCTLNLGHHDREIYQKWRECEDRCNDAW